MGDGVSDGGHFREGDLEGECGLSSLVFIGPVVMQTVPATAGQGIVKGNAEIVAPEKPTESTLRLTPPEFIASDAEGVQTGGNHGLGLDWLLVEFRTMAVFPVESVVADRSEVPNRGLLLDDEPAKTFESDCQRAGMWYQLSAEDERLAEPRVLVGQGIFKPRPLVVGAFMPEIQQSFS